MAKMHQIRFRLRLRPRPRWGAYSAPPCPYLDLRGLFLRARSEEKGNGGEEEVRGRGRTGKGREGEENGVS